MTTEKTNNQNLFFQTVLQQSLTNASSTRRPQTISLNAQYTRDQDNSSNPNSLLPPHTPMLRPRSVNKRNKLNSSNNALTLPKSHNNFDIKLRSVSEDDTNTTFCDSNLSTSQQDEESFVSWESILSAIQPADHIYEDFPSTLINNGVSTDQTATIDNSNLVSQFYESPIKNFLYPYGLQTDIPQGLEGWQTIQQTYNIRPRGASQ